MLKGVRGREAPPAGAVVNLTKTFVQAAVIWTVIFAVIPAMVLRAEDAAGISTYRFASSQWRMIGGLIFMLAGALNLAAACVMAVKGKGTPLPATCTCRLVVAGPFRYLRNQMAVATFAQGVGLGLFLGSPTVVAGSFGAALVWQWVLRPWEEQDLEQRFGEPYHRYRSAVRCWVPRLRAYVSPADLSDAQGE